MRAEPIAATCYAGIYPGRADQLHHVRRAVARHLAGCPAADDATLILSELAANAIVHSASRGQFFTVRTEVFPDYVWVEAEDLGGPWRRRQRRRPPARPGPWSKRSPARTAGASRPPPAAAGSSGPASTCRRGSEQHVTPPHSHGTTSITLTVDEPRHCPVCDGRGSRDVSDVSRRQAASVNVPARPPSLGLMEETETLSAWAERLARTLLERALPRRWAHVQGVAARARGLAPTLGADAELLEAAAWLHDIGYLPELAQTGMHGLDGARYLRDVQPRRTPAVPPGRAPFLRRHRGRRTRPGRPPEPRVRPRPAAAGRRADLLRHDHQPRRRARPGDTTAWPRSTTATAPDHLVSRSMRRATPLILEAVGQVDARAARP